MGWGVEVGLYVKWGACSVPGAQYCLLTQNATKGKKVGLKLDILPSFDEK